jgi:predicted outer membrane repeat protein
MKPLNSSSLLVMAVLFSVGSSACGSDGSPGSGGKGGASGAGGKGSGGSSAGRGGSTAGEAGEGGSNDEDGGEAGEAGGSGEGGEGEGGAGGADCPAGYAGAACDDCAAGYYEHPASSGTCIDDPCAPDACHGHGSCDNESGSAVCDCATGYTDASHCGECDTGYYEYPANSGTCVDDPCLPDPCNGNGTCDNASGAFDCACDAGYSDGSNCVACDAGYYEYPTSSGLCVDDPCLPDACNGHGACSNSSGSAVCDCATGYTDASNCGDCEAGYHEYPASSGTCVDDPCLPDPCNGNGSCSNASGAFDCACDAGYSDGSNCLTCDAGYYEYPASSGLCVDDPCLPDACNGHGTCSNTSGSASCDCATGYTDASNCGDCAAGYYEYPAGSGTCIDDPCLPEPCNGNGTCDNASGVLDCNCDAGYSPSSNCSECDAGYYEYPASSGLCVEDPCGGAACSGNGTCDNSTGSAVCTCDVGALLDDCSRCLRLVDPDATGANNGLTWADAYTNIQAALNDAWSTIGAGEAASCEVWVRSGVYYVYDTDFQSIVFGTNTDLYGGFAGDETERDQRDPEAYPTVLDGRSEGNPNLRAQTVVTTAADVVLDGFTVTEGNGFENGGGGLRHVSGGLTIANCKFENNTGIRGGAIYVTAHPSPADVTILDSSFSGNSAVEMGGAIYGGTQSELSIENCEFESNGSVNYGGAVSTHGDLLLDRSRFILNTAHMGAALWASKGVIQNSYFFANKAPLGGAAVLGGFDQVRVENSLFLGNHADVGGAFYGSGQGLIEIVNSTMVGNHADQSEPGAHIASGSVSFTNTVMWGNSGPGDQLLSFGYTTFNHSHIPGSGGANPGFTNVPSLWDRVVASTTNTVTVADGAQYQAGEYIHVAPDFEDLLVTGVVGNVVSFAPSLAVAPAVDALILDWDVGESDRSLNLTPTANSLLVDAADGDAAPELDLIGSPRYDEPSQPNLGTGSVNYADIGALEYSP